MKKQYLKEESENVIDFVRIGKQLIKRCWIMVLLGTFCMGLVYLYANYMIEPVYSSSTTLMIKLKDTGDGTTASSTLQTTANMSYSYQVILQSDKVLTSVSEALDNEVPVGVLSNNVTVEAAEGTGILRITASYSDPVMAQRIANAYSQIAPGQITEIADIGYVNVVDYGQLSTKPSSPDVMQLSLFGLLAGIALGGVLIVLLSITDTTIYNKDILAEMTDIPVIGVIPDWK